MRESTLGHLIQRRLALLTLSFGLMASACGSDAPNDSEPLPDTPGESSATPEVGGETEGSGPPAPWPGEERPPGALRTPAGFHVLPPYPVSCDSPSGRVRIPFFYTSAEGFPIVQGDRVGGAMIWPNESLGIGTLTADGARIALHAPFECVDDTECAAPFRCASTGPADSPRYCTMQSGVRLIPGTVRQDVDPGLSSKRQLISLLVQNTASFEGRLPSTLGGLYDADGERDLFSNPDRATDPGLVHKASIKDFFLQLRSALDPQKTRVSLWWFSGDVPAETRYLTGEGLNDYFTDELDRLEDIFDTMPNAVPRTANVWQSILRVVDRDFALEQYTEDEKFLILFTDTVNQVFDAAAMPENVSEALERHGVKLLVFHLDTAVDPSTLRDLPSYWAGNRNCQESEGCAGAPPCTSGANCEHFEECRPATVYAADAGGSVTESEQSYCMPRYDDSGRLGPIDVYADLACRSGGHYFYFPEPEAMIPAWRTLAYMFNGQWSVEAELSALDTGASIPDAFYRLSGTFSGTLGPIDHGVILGAPVAGQPGYDTRPLMRLGRPSAP